MTRNRDSTTADFEPPTGSPTDQTDASSERLDPATLAEDPGVDVATSVYPHSDADHCEADATGRAILGLTRDDGAALLAVNDEAGHASLPNATVAPDETFRAAGRAEVEDVLGAPVTVGDPVAVRRVEHYTTDDPDAVGDAEAFDAGDATPHNVTHHVVFEASLAAEAGSDRQADPSDAGGGPSDAEGDPTVPAPTVERDDWEVDWYHEVPAAVPDEDGDAVADIRRFLD